MSLSTRTHGALDYVLGIATSALPWILGLPLDEPAGWAPTAIGVALIINALATDFELGILRKLHIPVHLWIDGLLGLLLAISPWLLGFDRSGWIPHLVLGAVIIAAAFLTDTIPGYDRRGTAKVG
jgi:hypothetical protein